MQFSLNKLRHGAILVGILICSALPGHAQFGGVVFDPTQSAHALQQIEQGAARGLKPVGGAPLGRMEP